MCVEAYNAFFQRYPYCYGYWKKYSDMHKKHGDLIKAAEVSSTLFDYVCALDLCMCTAIVFF